MIVEMLRRLLCAGLLGLIVGIVTPHLPGDWGPLKNSGASAVLGFLVGAFYFFHTWDPEKSSDSNITKKKD